MHVLTMLKLSIVVVLAAITLLLCQYRKGYIKGFTTQFHHIARRTVLCCLLLITIPILLRLSLLPWWPVPIPRVHDDFSHLLVADTLHSGRLANPTHPFWRHFETQYILHQPTYSSIYPPGNGALMAVGIFISGNPWGGVLLGTGLLIYWMLLGWLSAPLALLGGILCTFHFALFHPWLECYWGGVLAACGGAVLFGTLPRLFHAPTYVYPCILIFGWSIIWFTRPYEAAVVALTLVPILLWWARGKNKYIILSTMLPLFAGGFLTACTFLYWQPKLTGPVPEQLHLRKNFLWQQAAYERVRSINNFTREFTHRCYFIWSFCATYFAKGLPILLLPVVLFGRRDPYAWLAVTFILVSFIGSLLYLFLYTHYLAHCFPLWLVLLLCGLRELWQHNCLGPEHPLCKHYRSNMAEGTPCN